MANVNNATGLTPIGDWGGGAYTGQTVMCYIPSTDTDGAVYIGDIVKLSGTADADGVPTVSGAITTGGSVFGVVVGVVPVTADSLTYRADATSRHVFVAPATATGLFVIQDDGAGAFTVGSIGSTADLTLFGTGSTVTGKSALAISGASITASGDGTEDVRIVGFLRVPNNDITSDYARWIVQLNNLQLVDGFAGV